MPYKYAAAVRGYITPLMLSNFSGGWNARDAPSEVADTESPACLNVTLDERGGVVKRLGLSRLVSGLNGPPSNVYWWATGNSTFVQDGADLKKTTDYTGFTTIHTFTTSDRCAMADFNGKLVIVHPIDGFFASDGTAGGTALVSTGPKGSCIAVWQNKVWVSGDPGAFARVYACTAGDQGTWGAQDYIDIREKDSLPVTAMGAGQGMDISGRPGLLVWKADSMHRINDSKSGTTFGAYTTLHNRAGASGPDAIIASTTGQIGHICSRGIYLTNGVDPPQKVSGKIEPFFSSAELNFSPSVMRRWCAGRYQDRLVFSVARWPSQVNNYTLEFSPTAGWITPHNFGINSFAERSINERVLFGGSPTQGCLFDVFKSGVDDGQPIASRWQSRWFEPSGGYLLRMRRLIIAGRGDFALYTKGDYTLGQGVLSHFVSGGTGGIWGNVAWGNDRWGTRLYETYQPFYSLGVARSVSFELVETSGSSVNKPPMNNDGSTAEVGNFALYGLKLDHVRLGYV